MGNSLLRTGVLATLLSVFLPGVVFAQQGALAGTVRDTTGAVLPGVTVEATSPALIEKVRTTTTDQNGQYRIPALPVGTYSVKFTLPGFTPASRPDIVINTGFTASVDGQLTVGLSESINVLGEAPVVDVENAREQRVVEGDELRDLPSGRTANALLNLEPSLNGSNGICTGGTCGYTLNAYSAHGGNQTEGRLQVMAWASARRSVAPACRGISPMWRTRRRSRSRCPAVWVSRRSADR